MSSTAILAKMLAERLELNSQHGRAIIGVLLFQDLAVVPFLILTPALAQAPEDLLAHLAHMHCKGGGRSRSGIVRRPAAHAAVVSSGRAAKVTRAVHAQFAVVHARLAWVTGVPACRSRSAHFSPAC